MGLKDNQGRTTVSRDDSYVTGGDLFFCALILFLLIAYLGMVSFSEIQRLESRIEVLERNAR